MSRGSGDDLRPGAHAGGKGHYWELSPHSGPEERFLSH